MSQANVYVKVGADGSIENIAMQKSEDIDIEAVWDGMPEGWPEVHAFKTYTSKTDKKLHIYFSKADYEKYIADEQAKAEKEAQANRRQELFGEITDHIEEKEVESDKEGYKKTEVRLGELVLWSYYTEISSTADNG